MGDVRARVADVAVHFAHDANVLIAIQQRVFVFTMNAGTAAATMRGLVCFEAGIGQDDD